MKKYIIFIAFLMLFNSLLAQNDPNCGKEKVETSTDWRRYNANDLNFPNNWDWTTQPAIGYPVYLTNNQINPSFYIDLPYRCRNRQGQGSCGQVNALHYEILELEGKKQDIYPEDGWELLIKNFGTPTIGMQIGSKVDNPFYILYNRINGKMRIFMPSWVKNRVVPCYLRYILRNKAQLGVPSLPMFNQLLRLYRSLVLLINIKF